MPDASFCAVLVSLLTTMLASVSCVASPSLPFDFRQNPEEVFEAKTIVAEPMLPTQNERATRTQSRQLSAGGSKVVQPATATMQDQLRQMYRTPGKHSDSNLGSIQQRGHSIEGGNPVRGMGTKTMNIFSPKGEMKMKLQERKRWADKPKNNMQYYKPMSMYKKNKNRHSMKSKGFGRKRWIPMVKMKRMTHYNNKQMKRYPTKGRPYAPKMKTTTKHKSQNAPKRKRWVPPMQGMSRMTMKKSKKGRVGRWQGKNDWLNVRNDPQPDLIVVASVPKHTK